MARIGASGTGGATLATSGNVDGGASDSVYLTTQVINGGSAATVAEQIQLRRDTAADWTSTNPVLAQGEVGYESDTDKLKVGDGVTAWNSLPYTNFGGVATVTASSPVASSGGFNPNITLTTVPVSLGGTGQTSAANAINALVPSQTGNSGDFLTTNGTVVSWAAGGGGGITQLTGDVTAGPGSGSQAALVAKIQGVAVGTPTGTGNVVFSASPTLTGTFIAASGTMSGTLLIPLVEGLASAGTLTLQGGTAASNGNGGSVTLQSATGSNVSTGGNGGNVNINGGAAQGNGAANQTGGPINLTAGNSVGSGTGGTVTIQCGTGGTGTSTAGATGGTVNVNGGTGGAGSATSGNGGGATLKAGSGGGGVTAGQGGTAQLTGGTGGTGSGSGGTGGAANVQGGSPGSFAGAAGGTVTVAGGNGSGTGSGGAGGSVTINTGTAGGDNTTNNGGGSFTLSVGHSMGSSGGANVTVTAGTGGVGSSSTGANGGTTNINAGNGGAGSATGGTGGNVVISAGTGGNSASPGAAGVIQFQSGANTSVSERFRVSSTACYTSNSQLQVNTAGFGLGIAHGSNCKLGTSTLSAGTITVSNTAITSNSIVFLTNQSVGGTAGTLSLGTVVAGTSFVINSSSGSDTSKVAWLIIEGL